MEKSFEQQLLLIEKKSDLLMRGTSYPFDWNELLSDVVVPNFIANRPYCFLKDGAKTWGALAGGTKWHGGDYGNMLWQMENIDNCFPDSELFTICHASFPDEVRNASLEELKSQPTVLAHFLCMSILNLPSQARASDAGWSAFAKWPESGCTKKSQRLQCAGCDRAWVADMAPV